MISTQKNFYRYTPAFRGIICSAIMALFAFDANAAVVSRGAASNVSARPTVSTRTNNTGRMPSATVSTSTTTTTTTETETETTAPETDSTDDEIVIENKASQFDTTLSTASTTATDTSSDRLAELIRQQRAELDAQSAINTATTSTTTGGRNACDSGLRACMQEKCGTDFTNCSGDTDTTWGNKMDSCRNSIDATCTGEEYRLFAAEIKSDRDMNARLASYNAILDCGNRYNDCIVTECGTTFSKCLGKSAGDAAIAKCKTIADNCTQQDSGLASRAMQVFANLRVDAEEQVQRDEQRLYELRDEMAAAVSKPNALMFVIKSSNSEGTVPLHTMAMMVHSSPSILTCLEAIIWRTRPGVNWKTS